MSGRDGAESTDGTDGDDPADRHTYWTRPSRLRSDLSRVDVEHDEFLPLGHLHRFCDVTPFSKSPSRANASEISFLQGVPRWALRHTPLFVLLATVGLLVYGQLSQDVQGVSALLPAIPPIRPSVVAGLGVVWGVIVGLLARVGLIDVRDFFAAVVVYGLLGVLLAGTAFSTYLVLTAKDPTTLPPNVVFLSGYLLLLLITGILVYDGMLRTESLFSNLEETDIVVCCGRYASFLHDLDEALNDTVLGSIPTSHVFAVLFVAQFGVMWHLLQGPQNLESSVTLALNLVFDLLIAIVAFRFLVLVSFFHALMTDTYRGTNGGPGDEDPAGEQRLVRYEPFHVDHHGGFRDFGRFATRVNLLLILAGLYLVYRFYVQGLRVFPIAGITEFATSLEALIWLGSYVAPVLVYAVAAGAWLYYSFWAMHRKMLHDKLVLFADSQGVRGDDGVPTVGDPAEAFETGADWVYLESAPEWPIKSRWMITLVSANVVPLLLPLVRLVIPF